ncbi:MAG: prepilin-type N-terminal cleavage/methylation domain-containing protein [Oscillospiraceae bacterium]|nr:prepilin-type N-terminal cleavage/methylation domain-containing protein [Oscillospiraceae bacterium]
MKKLNNRGMTLVETIVAFTLITVVSLIAVTGFTAAATIMRRGLDAQSACDAAAAALEAGTDTQSVSGQLRFYAQDGRLVGSVGGAVESAQEAVNDNEAALSRFTAD